MAGWGIFSTLKVDSGVLFEFDRHWSRMKRDAALFRIPFEWEPEALERELLRVVEANQAPNSTLRVYIYRNRGSMWVSPGMEKEWDIVAMTADRSQWGASASLGVIPHGRHAQSPFAGTKINSWAANLVLYEQAHLKGLDEVVLLNERGDVAECTSANIFAIFGNEVMTPPLSSGCLPGVTREVVLECIAPSGVLIAEKTLTLADLGQADCVFITSTTRDLMPVAAIESIEVAHNHRVFDLLLPAFRNYAQSYTRSAARRAKIKVLP